MNGQARLRLVTLATIHALEGCLLRLGFVPNPLSPLKDDGQKNLKISVTLTMTFPKKKKNAIFN
jgi:hypothetical protein